ncbi:MAG: hotdog domain-containing protein [Pseudomonadota bacterium]
MKAIEKLSALEAVRDKALDQVVQAVPYHRFLGIECERLGDELTTRLRFTPKLIGNPVLPALHGGVTGSFLEITSILQLAWANIGDRVDAGGEARAQIEAGRLPMLPKTIDITVDYLRSGRARDAYARAIVTKHGRRVANVRVEAWQDERARPFAAAHGHFLLPPDGGS